MTPRPEPSFSVFAVSRPSYGLGCVGADQRTPVLAWRFSPSMAILSVYSEMDGRRTAAVSTPPSFAAEDRLLYRADSNRVEVNCGVFRAGVTQW
jgi:hypothetical protein